MPVIAALAANAQGLAWLFGLCCDAVVYRRDGRYAASPLWSAPALAREAAALCALRFCPSFGREVSLSEGGYAGTELQARAGTLRVVDGAEVMSEALRARRILGCVAARYRHGVEAGADPRC